MFTHQWFQAEEKEHNPITLIALIKVSYWDGIDLIHKS